MRNVIDAVFSTRNGGEFKFIKDGVLIEDPFKEGIVYYNSSNRVGVAAEMGMVISEKEVFVLDIFAGTDVIISFARPYISDYDTYMHLLNGMFSKGTEQEMRTFGKAWHIYITELLKARERQKDDAFTFMPALMIPWKEIQ